MNILRLSTDLQADLLRGLTSQSHMSTMLNPIVERAADVLGACACSIYVIDAGGRTATQRAGTGYQRRFVDRAQCDVLPASQVPESPADDRKLGISGWIMSTGRSVLARSPEELSRHPHHSGRHDPEQSPGEELRLRSFLGVPLRTLHGEIIGMIKAERRERSGETVEPFSVQDQIALETMARVASKCLTYLDMAQRGLESAAVTAWAREVIGEAVVTEGELDSFLDVVARVTAAAMRADSCGIFLTDESGKTLTQRAGTGSQALRDVIRAYPFPEPDQVRECQAAGVCVPGTCRHRPAREDRPGRPDPRRVGLTAWIAATGKSFHAPNYDALRKHCHHRGGFDPWNFPRAKRTVCGAWLGAPLRVGGAVIGVLKVENISKIDEVDERDFAVEAQQRFDILAEDVALAIVRLQMQSPTRYQLIRDAQPTILKILRGGLDIPVLAKEVVTETAKLFNARACALFLKEGNQLIQPPWAAYGWALKGPEVRRYDLVRPDQIKERPAPEEKVGLTVWIAVKQEKFTARSNLELTMHPHHKGTFDAYNFDPEQRCESFMGVPLRAGDQQELVGVLKVETKMRRGEAGVEEYTYFTEQDELVFDLIANSVAIAIENAKLLESQRLAEQIRRQPNSLLLDLHVFVREHWQPVDTLRQAADLLRGKSPHVARIIDHYAALLQPEFRIELLEAVPGLIAEYGEFMEGSHQTAVLYRAFVEALAVRDVDALVQLCRRRGGLADPQLLDSRFYLVKAASLLVDLYGQIASCLPAAGGADLGASLSRVRERLREAQEKAERLSRPERDIVGRIVERWLVLAEPPFVPVENPYVAGGPIQPGAGSPFFGRQDVFDWVAENLHGATQPNVLVLHGERRMGKTSILLQLERGSLGEPLRRGNGRPLVPVFIDLQALVDPGTHLFLASIARSISDKVALHPAVRQKVPAPAVRELESAPSAVFNQFMDEVCQRLGRALLVLMLDEFEALESRVREGKLEPTMYEFLRHQMQHRHNVTFILAGTHQPSELSQAYSKMVSGAVAHEVGFMRDEEAQALVRKPVEGRVIYEDDAVEELLRVTHGHPYLLQLLCQHLISEMNLRWHRNIVRLGDVRAAVEHSEGNESPSFSYMRDDFTHSEQVVLSALASIVEEGQANASQEALLDRLVPALAESEVTSAVARLVRRRLIQESETRGKVRYHPTIAIFSRWIARHYPLVKLLKG